MKKVTVNGKKEFSIEGNEIDGQEIILDVMPLEDRFWHVLYHGKSYTIELIKKDAATKTADLRVNDTVYTVSVKDKMDQLLESMGLEAAGAGKMKNLKAPMPGLVLDVRVDVGATVTKGDALLVLEAMKMENVLKAEGDGVVKSVEVKKDQNVEKGHVMINFE